MQTLRLIKRQLTALTAFAPPLICSIGLSACNGLKPFPADHIIEYDPKNRACGYYKITDPEHFKVQYVKDVPCPAVFGFESKDIPKILDWGQDAQDYVRNNCH